MTKIFISYSHDNEQFLEDNLIPMFNELEKEKIAEYFYDRKLRADTGLFDTIDFKIKDCDIAIVLLSESYYNSESCTEEKVSLLTRRVLDGIYLLPLVISDCAWKNDDTIKNNLFLNTDAKELSLLPNNELKMEIAKIKDRIIAIARDIETIHSLTFTNTFADSLQDTDVLKTSHRSKNTLLLSDVFVYPTLRKFIFDDEKDDEINAKKLFEDSKDSKFVFISGDDLSGKTSLLRRYVSDLREKNFIPLYFSSENDFNGHIFNILAKEFKKQFNIVFHEEDIDRLLEDNRERIVLFIDDFHKISNKQKIVDKINIFSKIICTVDLIYNLDYEIKNIKNSVIPQMSSFIKPCENALSARVLFEKRLPRSSKTVVVEQIETTKQALSATFKFSVLTCADCFSNRNLAYVHFLLFAKKIDICAIIFTKLDIWGNKIFHKRIFS